jgi:putative FmdB family regulatory protein
MVMIPCISRNASGNSGEVGQEAAMPVYVYNCSTCEVEIEERRPIAEADAELLCPICGAKCQRVVAVPFGVMGQAASGSGPAAGSPLETWQSTSEVRYGTPRHMARCPCCVPLRRAK